MLHQFFKSTNIKNTQNNINIQSQIIQQKNLSNLQKNTNSLQSASSKVNNIFTQIQPIQLKQNTLIPNSITTLRKQKKFKRTCNTNTSSKVYRKDSYTLRNLNCDQDFINQAQQVEINNEIRQTKKRSGSIIFPKREIKLSQVSFDKKKAHLVRSNKVGLNMPKNEVLKSLCKENSDEIGNIKPLRMCLQQYIYCTGKRVKYIPMSSILKSPKQIICESQLTTQHTIQLFNFKEQRAQRKKSNILSY